MPLTFSRRPLIAAALCAALPGATLLLSGCASTPVASAVPASEAPQKNKKPEPVLMPTIDAFKGDETAGGKEALKEAASILLRTLYPVAPHITTSLWGELGFIPLMGDIIDAKWPEWSEEVIKADELKLVVQVNGKLRGSILVSAEASEDEIREAALANPDVKKFVGEATVRRVIIVKNKLVNVVAK